MSMNKRITDLTDFTSVLPYASEMFGVYQPMIGWKSKRLIKRLNQGIISNKSSLLQTYVNYFKGISKSSFTQCDAQITMQVGVLPTFKVGKNNTSVLLQTLISSNSEDIEKQGWKVLPKDTIPVEQEWKDFINKENLEKILNSAVSNFYRNLYHEECTKILALPLHRGHFPEEIEGQSVTERNLENNITTQLNQESALAGAMLAMLDRNMFSQLETLFYVKPRVC